MTTGSATTCFVFVLFSVLVPGISLAYDYDPDDFAVEVVYYDPGTGVGLDYLTGIPFDDPNNALGEPTVDTTGENWKIPVSETVPVVSVYPAFRSFELVTVGNGGQLILKFSRPVADDQNNPYGIDLIIFGNAQLNVGEYWTNEDPADFSITGSGLIAEAGVVSVSQDGVSWYTFDPNSGPFADTFAPTLGRVYDPNNYDGTIGAWNQWWGKPTNPTLPLDPNITPSDMVGLSVAQAAQFYGESAGGTGFDISELGLDWIEYVKIDGNDYVTPEIDAVSDVAACGDYKHPLPEGDLNLDCRVDIVDVRLLGENWLRSCDGGETPEDIGDISGDCKVNLADLAMINNSWLECSWDCQ